jgi:hypothetical protein
MGDSIAACLADCTWRAFPSILTGLIVILATLVMLTGCTRDDSASSTLQAPIVHTTSDASESALPRSNANRDLLDQVNAAGLWFHARKTRPIWARRLEQAERVTTLEGEEDVPAGTYLCRGEAGDLWPQTAERLEAKYLATDEVSADGWRKHLPHPDNTGVMAAGIDGAFAVTAQWGKLTGKPGDYLVKNYDDRDAPYPDDVWIVDASLFEATYERVENAEL